MFKGGRKKIFLKIVKFLFFWCLFIPGNKLSFNSIFVSYFSQVFLFIGSDAFNCCTFLSGFLLLAGTQDGNIYQLDVRSPR